MSKKNYKIFYKSIAITFAIMFFSLLISQIVYQKRVNQLNNSLASLKLELEEEKVYLEFLDQVDDGKNRCSAMESSLTSLSLKAEFAGQKVKEVSSEVNDVSRLKEIQKEWVLLNLQVWLRLNRYNQNCQDNAKDYILYFYPYECRSCTPYTALLNDLKKEHSESLWLFSIPSEIEISFVETLKDYYKIKDNQAAVVVNGKVFFEQDILSSVEKELVHE